MSSKLNILITCSSGKFTYDLVSALKSIKDFNINIFGVDANPKPNMIFMDKQYKIPNYKKSKQYLKKLFSICEKEKIKIIFPLSENETILFSKNKHIFEKKKIKILISDIKIVSNLVDKVNMFKFLEKKKINIGKWKLIQDLRDMLKFIKILGYPDKKIILKQRFGSGSRGVVILNKKIKKFKYLLKNRFCGTGNLNSVIKEFKRNKISFKNLLCMPYYSGDVYDVDCLAIYGKPKVVIPRLRQYDNPLSPTNEGCILKRNLKIENYIKKIISVLKIHGPCDFDIVFDKKGLPKLLDGSCRMSGSVGASFVAGFNLPEQIVKYLVGRKIKNIFPKKKYRLLPVSKFVLINK